MYLNNSKKIVIKIGSSLLINDKKVIRKKWLSEFSKDVKQLLDEKKNVIIVSSGAIALGCKKLNLNKKNLKLDKSQAVASVGQIELMNLFKKIFNKKRINLSQILLTLEDTEQRRRAINAKRTIENLFLANRNRQQISPWIQNHNLDHMWDKLKVGYVVLQNLYQRAFELSMLLCMLQRYRHKRLSYRLCFHVSI